MRPATIRRLLVFGVCALGVGALYLVPDVSAGPGQQAGTRVDPSPEPAGQPVAYDGRATLNRTDTLGGEQPTGTGGNGSGRAGLRAGESPDRRGTEQGTNRIRRHGSTGFGGSGDGVERGGRDDEAPSVVSALTFPTVSADRLTVRWPAADDNVGVTQYRIWLNGYHVADTTALQVAIPWFTDGSRQQVVQVRAVDAAGNQSSEAPARLVERPAADPARDGQPPASPATSAPPAAASPSPDSKAAEQPAASTSETPAEPGTAHSDGNE